MNLGGFVFPALSIGLGALRLKPITRGFYPSTGSAPILAQVTLEEQHHDEMEITEHPIEQGAAISDHAYKRAAEVVVHCGFSNSPPSNPGGLVGAAIGGAATLGGSAIRTIIGAATTAQSLLGGNSPRQAKDLYADFLAAQSGRVLFDVYTGKRVYRDMLIKSLAVTTDKTSENDLLITIIFRQVIIVNTRVIDVAFVNPDALANPAKYTPVRDFGQSSLVPSALTITAP